MRVLLIIAIGAAVSPYCEEVHS